jgi:hypothetical protein
VVLATTGADERGGEQMNWHPDTAWQYGDARRLEFRNRAADARSVVGASPRVRSSLAGALRAIAQRIDSPA